MSLKTANITNLSWEKYTTIICCVFFAFFVSACGGGGGSGGSSSSNVASGTGGSIAFSVDWKDASYPSATGAYLASSLDCSGAGVSEVTAQVYDENGTYLISGGPWPCSAHSGTINNVPEGSNMMVVVTGKDSNGNELHGGEATGINVTQGQTTNAGTIETVSIDMTVEDLIANGLNNMKDGVEALMAHDYFYGAKIKTRGSSSNNADIARFFYAISKAATQAYNIESDGENDGLQDLGDIMDAFGATASGRLPFFKANGDFRDESGEYYDDPFPEPLPFGSPTGAELQNFCFNVLRPALEAAIASLNLVSTSFNKTWLEPVDDELVDSDYGDVLYVKAIFQGTLALIYTQRAYNLNVDIYAEDQADKTDQQFINTNPNLGTLGSSYGSYLSTAKQLSLNCLTHLRDAIDWIQNETDAQSDDWVNLVDETSSEIDEAKLDIVDAKNSMNGPTVVRDNDPFTLDLSVFFAGLDFRSPDLLPPYRGNDPGFFPDPTLKGIVGVGEDLNEDLHNEFGVPVTDGIPDVLQ